MASLHALISPDFFKEMTDAPEGAIPLNACVVVEYLDGDGNHMLASGWTDDMTYYTREGMCRNLLRDAMMVPLEAERREAARQLDDLEGDD